MHCEADIPVCAGLSRLFKKKKPFCLHVSAADISYKSVFCVQVYSVVNVTTILNYFWRIKLTQDIRVRFFVCLHTGFFCWMTLKKKNNNNIFGPRQKFTCATAQKNMLCTIVCYFIIRGLTIQSNARGLIYNVSINKKQQAFDSSSLNTRRLNKFYNPVNNDLRKRWSQRHCNNTCNKTCCQSHVKNVVQIKHN